MTLRRTKFFVIAVFSTAMFLVAASIVHRILVDNWNHKHLNELAAQTLTRAEVAVDLSIMNMFELSMAVEPDCNSEFKSEMRKTIFSVGTLKNIHLITGNKNCAGYSDRLSYPLSFGDKTKRYAALNPDYSFKRMETTGWVGLGVFQKLDENQELLAVMSTDALLFDMLPQALREHTTMELTIGDSTVVAEYRPEGWQGEHTSERTQFTIKSERYPFAVQMQVNKSRLAEWNNSLPSEAIFAVLFIAISIGLLSARSLVPPANLADKFDEAIRSGEIVPYFQPIVSLSDQKIIGCEMLARWIKPDGSQVSPGHFIRIAEISGKVDQMTEALFKSAGRSIGPVLYAKPDLKFTFNITPEQFLSDGFVKQIVQLGATSVIPQSQMVVEITERQEIANLSDAQQIIRELNEAGIQVALDDVGTGHNGLACIRKLGASYIKIDKLFVDALDRDPRTRTLVEMLVNIGREFDMMVVAEGIERIEQAAALVALGVHEGQGFLYSRPLPAEEFLKLLNTGFTEISPPSSAPDTTDSDHSADQSQAA